jgi:hypothetical protein
MAGIRAVSKPKEKKIRCSIDRCTNSYVKQHGVKSDAKLAVLHYEQTRRK